MECNTLKIDVSSAQREVVAWLRDGALNGDPLFLLGQPESQWEERIGELAERIVHTVRKAGFELEVKPKEENGRCEFHTYWKYRGHELVGFKQAPAAPDEAEAKVLACAALIRNEWCRARLALDNRQGL